MVRYLAIEGFWSHTGSWGGVGFLGSGSCGLVGGTDNALKLAK
jgi:hypothetical protein